MKIKSIKIKSFKSIHSTQTVEFAGKGLITFIGKNGSGKTNVLEAVNEVFRINGSTYRGRYSKIDYSVILELDNKTISSLSKDLKYTPQDRFIEVYNDGRGNETESLKVNVMRSTLYTKELKRIADEVKAAAEDVSGQLNNFKQTLDEIRIPDFYCDGYLYTVEELKSSETCCPDNYYTFNNYCSAVVNLIDSVKKIVGTINENEREIELYRKEGYEYENRYDSPRIVNFPKPEFQLRFREPNMTELDRRFITVDRDGIKRVIAEVNEKMRGQSSGLRKSIEVLNKKIDKFRELIVKANDEEDEYYHRFEKKQEKKQAFLEKVTDAVGRKCYYIPATEQYGGRRYYYDDGYDRSYDYGQLLIETYITLKYDGQERDEMLQAYEKSRDIDKVLTKSGVDKADFAADFEKRINENLPAFERNMIEKIEVRYDRGIELSVVEKDGGKTPFENTSTGRRWYFAYYFIKSCLKDDDVLILDEPGVFLHPEAQTELLRGLEELAEKHTVLMCTHSPYMISGNSSVHLVRMTENGTAVSHMRLQSLKKGYKDAGLADFNSLTLNNVILNISAELILCEGPRDIACIEAFMDYFKIDKNRYRIMHLNGYTHAKPIIEIYVNNGVKVRMLLDKDTQESIKDKKITVPTELSENRSMTIGEIPEEYITLAFAGSKNNSDKDDIEGLFSDNDRDIFLEPVKIGRRNQMKARMDIGNILLTRGCDKLTAYHFKALFKKLKLFPEQNDG